VHGHSDEVLDFQSGVIRRDLLVLLAHMLVLAVSIIPRLGTSLEVVSWAVDEARGGVGEVDVEQAVDEFLRKVSKLQPKHTPLLTSCLRSSYSWNWMFSPSFISEPKRSCVSTAFRAYVACSSIAPHAAHATSMSFEPRSSSGDAPVATHSEHRYTRDIACRCDEGVVPGGGCRGVQQASARCVGCLLKEGHVIGLVGVLFVCVSRVDDDGGCLDDAEVVCVDEREP
jgi:hypothetical protein